ncbi:hypothetical protein Tco_0799813 [Tanacetum coccineum]|uniref:Transposase (Putative), gypsy type n=1 Tax=Tanacetum coccineum TaxID=301880 RepID=A0ABQ4ZV29_9ASTR
MYSDGLFSFAKRSLSAPSCLSKPPDSIKNWADHFFWVDSRVFPISVPLYTRGVLEKDPGTPLTHVKSRQDHVFLPIKPFRDMGLLDYIRTADPLEVQSRAHQASGSGSGAGAEVSVSSTEGNIIEENVIPEGAFLNLTDPECDVPLAEKDIVTSSRGKTLVVPTSDVGGSSQPEMSEVSADSFYETTVLNSEDAKRWYIPSRGIKPTTSLLDGLAFSDPRQICLGSEVRSRTEHELELKEKLRGKYDARGVLLREKDAEIARLKSLVKEKETESAEKDTDISLLDSRASYLKSALDDSQAACSEARNLISSLPSKRDGLASEKRWKPSSRAVDYGMQEGLAAGHEHGIAGSPLSAVVAYNPETAKNNYLGAVRALEEVDFPLVRLLKSKKDSGMDEQLSVIFMRLVNALLGRLFILWRFLMFTSIPTLLGEASTSSVIPCVEGLDTDEDLGSVVCMPQFEDPRFEILP